MNKCLLNDTPEDVALFLHKESLDKKVVAQYLGKRYRSSYHHHHSIQHTHITLRHGVVCWSPWMAEHAANVLQEMRECVCFTLFCAALCAPQAFLQQGSAGLLCAAAGCEGSSPCGVHQDVCQISDTDGFTVLGQICDG